mgnify:CR=1 FL=1
MMTDEEFMDEFRRVYEKALALGGIHKARKETAAWRLKQVEAEERARDGAKNYAQGVLTRRA